MEASSQLNEMARWLKRELGNPFTGSSNNNYERGYQSDQPQGFRSRLKNIIVPLILVQVLGFLQALSYTSSLALLNNAIMKPMLIYLLQSLFLCVFFNLALIRTYGFKSFLFIYEARAWLYLLFALPDFFAYKLLNDGGQLMPRAYTTSLPALVTILSLILTGVLIHNRYKIFHIIGIVIGMAGLALTVWGDQVISLNYFENTRNAILPGVFLTVFSVIFKSLSYLVLEVNLRRFSMIEVLGCYGTFGIVISFLDMIFVDSYETVTVDWSSAAVWYLLLASFSLFLSTVVLAVLAQRYTVTLASLANFVTGSLYIGLSNLGFKAVPAFQPTVFHVISYFVIMIGQVVYLFKPITIAKDTTYKLDFYRRP